MQTVLISGGSGLIGSHLSQMLTARGYAVKHLGRKKRSSSPTKHYCWDPANGTINKDALDSVDYIIHLAGAGIGDVRWSKKRKREIYDSRIKGTRLLFEAMQQTPNTIQAFIAASGVGYYGQGEEIFAEEDPPADDFLGKTCKDWESEINKVSNLGKRVVCFRTGLVLSNKGGALPRIHQTVRFGLGALIGNGKMYVPWIHIKDLCEMYIMAIEDPKMEGTFNAVAPEQVTNKMMTQSLALALKRSILLFPVPLLFFKLGFGELANFLFYSVKVSADRIKALNFTFQYPKLEPALLQLYQN